MSTASHLVGRDGVRGELAAAVRDALAGRGGLVVVTGEPGIGKTRLLSEVDGLAAGASGATVVHGSCWDDGAPAFWPWTQVLRECAAGRGAEELLTDWGPGARAALGLVPELAAPEDELPPTRFPLFDSVRAVLAGVAARRPLVVVLDDLHWADAGSLRLLRFVAHGLARQPVLLVGAHRDTEEVPGTGQLLEEIAASARVLALPGLDGDAVGALLAATTGTALDERTVADVLVRTGGNPLFVRELARLHPTWHASALPEGVRAVLRRRLARLPQDCHGMLGVASVLGVEFELEPLQACLDPGTDLLALLDVAAAARLIEPRDRTFAFSHALVRDVLYADLALGARGELHHRAGQAYERLDPGRLTELARHFIAALPVGDPLVAVDHAQRAGRAACTGQAYEVAAGHFRAALDALGGKDSGQRVELLLWLGDALLRTGEIGAARSAFQEAAELARGRGAPEELARAALGFGAGLSGFEVRLWDTEQIELLEEALEALGDNDSTLLAGIMARLSVALSFVAPTDRRRVLADQAVAMARRLDDPATLGHALAGHCDVIAGPDDVAARLAEATEIVTLAAAAGDRGLELLGRRLRVVALLELGDAVAAFAEIEAFARVAEAFRQPLFSWFVPLWRGLRAYLNGDLPEMARCADDAAETGALADSRNARTLATVARHWVTMETGATASFQEITKALRDLPELAGGNTQSVLDLYPNTRDAPTTRAALDNAAAILAELPVESEYLSNLCLAAWTVVEWRHAGAAEVLYEKLAPHAELFAVDGIAVASHGSVSRWLGALAHVLGQWGDAARHFENALAANRRALSPLNVAHTQRQYGALLAERDPAAAGPMLAAAREAYVAMGLTAWAAVIEPVPAVPAGAVFRPDGDVWLLSYAGTSVRLKASKGLRDIASLLANPGKEIHALDLVGAPGGGDLGPVLDEAARAAYQRRLTELAETISEASALGDLGALERAEAERDQLVDALTAAYGLGGRPRRAGDPAERARGTVTWRIRDALGRIEQAHPALGRHLRASVRTGTYCVYDPEVAPSWHLTS